MIYTYIPFAPKTHNEDLGWAYNNFMELLPNDEDWACFLDHDAMFTTKDWYSQLSTITEKHFDAGCFTAVTNRVGNPYQVHKIRLDLFKGHTNIHKRTTQILRIYNNNHDMFYHREIGKMLLEEKKTEVSELKGELSGVLMLVKKAFWKNNKFDSGLLGVDNNFHENCLKKGAKVYLMEGVYVYHWYRGDRFFSINFSSKLRHAFIISIYKLINYGKLLMKK